MTEILEGIFSRYGTEIQVERGDEAVYTEAAFIHPVRNSDKEFPFSVTGLGSVDDRHWLCMTRGMLQESDRVRFREKLYEAVSCAEISLAGETVYCRTILRPEQEAAV